MHYYTLCNRTHVSLTDRKHDSTSRNTPTWLDGERKGDLFRTAVLLTLAHLTTFLRHLHCVGQFHPHILVSVLAPPP